MTASKNKTGFPRGVAIGAVLLTLAGAMLLTLTGPDPWPDRFARSAPASEPLRVVASLGIFADMAANVGGEAVTVTALIPPGADPHSWEPSIREMRALAAADIFIFNGLGLEPWVERTLAAAAPANVSVVKLSEGLQVLGESRYHGTDSRGGQRQVASAPRADGDPHMWLDIHNGIAYVRRMEEAFTAAAPHRAEEIHRQAAGYVELLEDLDAWFQAQIDAIPPERRLLMTDHDAYVYMAERYGLRRVGFVTANPDREPSAREMARLAADIRAGGAPALFAEPHVGTSFIDELAREAGVPVGVLYTDAFFGDVRTYVDMMRANGDALRTFLSD